MTSGACLGLTPLECPWVYRVPARPVPRLGGGGWRCIWRVDVTWLALFVHESCHAVYLYVFVHLPLEEPSV